jgi:hypothetical protein
MAAVGVRHLEDIQGWVCDEMKPVNFRWLSNELSVPSNSAKQYVTIYSCSISRATADPLFDRLLFEFVEQEGAKEYADQVLQVYYLVAGKTACGHQVKLVPKEQLEGLALVRLDTYPQNDHTCSPL